MNQSLGDVEETVHTGTVASMGRMLVAAREGAGLSVEDAASKLRLSVRQVHALESDDIAALPAPTFVRGFIRNYAKLLNLDADELLQAYRVVAPETMQSTISLQSENIPIINQDRKSWMPYLLASMVVGLSVVGWMTYMEYAADGGKKLSVEKVIESSTPVAAPQVAATPPSMPPQQAVTTTSVPTAEPSAATPIEPAAVQAPALSSKISLIFSQSTWVSITDHSGKELLGKSSPSGTQNTIEGTPPFNIVIGNANGVQLTYNDKPVDLVPYTKSNVARLTLE